MFQASPERGISVLEVTLAIAIMAMAVASFLPVFTQGIQFTKEIRDYSILINLGEELIHTYIVQILKTPSTSPISFFEKDITQVVKTRLKNPVLDSLRSFKIWATVRPSLLCSSNGYEIIIKFDWETGGRKVSFSLFTLKAAREL